MNSQLDRAPMDKSIIKLALLRAKQILATYGVEEHMIAQLQLKKALQEIEKEC